MEEPKKPVEQNEPTEPKEPKEPESSVDIKSTPEYIAMKEMLDNQTAELEKLQNQVKDLQLEKERMSLSYGLEDKKQEELDNAWLGFSRYSHD